MFQKTMLVLFATLILAACASTPSSIQPITPLPSQQSDNFPPTASPSFVPPTLTTVLRETVDSSPATPTPLSNNLSAGESRAIAAATDAVIQPTPRHRIDFDAEPVLIRFDEFYDGYDLRYGLRLSDKLVSLDGRAVVMDGYMAPPLKPKLDYFVLTRIRLAFCPFCSTAADWPDDIALVYLPDGQTTLATERPVRVTGRVEVGQSVDQETGMVSLVRLYAETLETLS